MVVLAKKNAFTRSPQRRRRAIVTNEPGLRKEASRCLYLSSWLLVTPVEILLLFVLASHLKIFVVVVVFRLPLLVRNGLVIVPGVIITVISNVHAVMITAAAKR